MLGWEQTNRSGISRFCLCNIFISSRRRSQGLFMPHTSGSRCVKAVVCQHVNIWLFFQFLFRHIFTCPYEWQPPFYSHLHASSWLVRHPSLGLSSPSLSQTTLPPYIHTMIPVFYPWVTVCLCGLTKHLSAYVTTPSSPFCLAIPLLFFCSFPLQLYP